MENITNISIICVLNFVEQLRHRCCKDVSNINPETYDTNSLTIYIYIKYDKLTNLRWLHRERNRVAFSQVVEQIL